MRKHGDAKKYNAHVIHVGHECDIAMVIIVNSLTIQNFHEWPLSFHPGLEELFLIPSVMGVWMLFGGAYI